MNLKNEITKIHYNIKSNAWLEPILGFMSIFYGKITEIRNNLYDNGTLKSEKVDAFVISVGNLTTGGVGKTPVVAELAKHFINRGKKVAIISRGYGGKLSNKEPHIVSANNEIFFTAEEIGDEPFWFAQNVENAYVLTCSSRVKASKEAIKRFGVEVIILDDAFQHRKIQRDLDLVLVDSEKLFGNGKHLPAGPLRENLNGLKRADTLLIMNKSSKEVNPNILENFFDKKRTFVCNVIPSFTYNIKTTEVLPLKSDAFGMCAIGQPEQFYEFVRQKFNLLDTITFDDHHQYKYSEVAKIRGNIITTEKDAVKLAEFNLDNIYALKLKLDLDVESLLK